MNIKSRLFICITAMLGSPIARSNAGELPPDNEKIVTLIPSIVKVINPDAYGVNTQTAAGPSWSDPVFKYINSGIGDLREKNMVQCYAESLNTIINSEDKLVYNNSEIKSDQILLNPYSVSVLYY